MSVGDYLTETGQRFRQQHPSAAAREAAAEFRRGLRRRRDRLAFQWFGYRVIDSDLAGVSASFYANCALDAERARTLNREAPVAEWLFADCDGGDVFWDVGAYHGHYSTLAYLHGARVVAFEPDTGNRNRVWRNLCLNSDIRISHGERVRGNADGRMDVRAFAISDTDGQASFGGPADSELGVGDGDRTVTTRRGDSIDPAPTIVKLDVEGHELAALDGMAARLGVVHRIAVEVHAGVDPAAVRERLADAGLDVLELPSPRSQTYLGGVRR